MERSAGWNSSASCGRRTRSRVRARAMWMRRGRRQCKGNRSARSGGMPRPLPAAHSRRDRVPLSPTRSTFSARSLCVCRKSGGLLRWCVWRNASVGCARQRRAVGAPWKKSAERGRTRCFAPLSMCTRTLWTLISKMWLAMPSRGLRRGRRASLCASVLVSSTTLLTKWRRGKTMRPNRLLQILSALSSFPKLSARHSAKNCAMTNFGLCLRHAAQSTNPWAQLSANSPRARQNPQKRLLRTLPKVMWLRTVPLRMRRVGPTRAPRRRRPVPPRRWRARVQTGTSRTMRAVAVAAFSRLRKTEHEQAKALRVACWYELRCQSVCNVAPLWHSGKCVDGPFLAAVSVPSVL
eukprot:Opistho-2@61880